jgi:RecJ-like exonuclease
MPVVTNPVLKKLASRAREVWDAEERLHDVEYKLPIGGLSMMGWVNSQAHNAMLHTMAMQVIGNDVICTYMQVRRGGLAIRALTKIATVSDYQRWYRVFPQDRKLFDKLLRKVKEQENV